MTLLLDLPEPRPVPAPRIDLLVEEFVVASARFRWSGDRNRRHVAAHPNHPGKIDSKARDRVIHGDALRDALLRLHKLGVNPSDPELECNARWRDDIRTGIRWGRRRLRNGDIAHDRCQCSSPECARWMPKKATPAMATP